MECPHCGRRMEASEGKRCPGCGRRLESVMIGVVKTSQVRVAAGDEDRVYRSMEEIPPALRRRLRRVLNGPLTDTVVIADEAGRRRIFDAIRGLPPDVQKKVISATKVVEPFRIHLPGWAKVVVAITLFLILTVLIARLWV